MDIIEAFQGMNDPRIERHKRHSLEDILFISVAKFSMPLQSGRFWFS